MRFILIYYFIRVFNFFNNDIKILVISIIIMLCRENKEKNGCVDLIRLDINIDYNFWYCRYKD